MDAHGQIEEFLKEGYYFEKAHPKLKYIKLIGNKKENRELMKKRRFNIYPYLKRKDDMRSVIEDAKAIIREVDKDENKV